MRNTVYLFLCILTLFFCSTISAYSENLVTNKISNPSSPSIDSQPSAIQPLTVIRYMAEFQAVDGVTPFGEYWVNYESEGMTNKING